MGQSNTSVDVGGISGVGGSQITANFGSGTFNINMAPGVSDLAFPENFREDIHSTPVEVIGASGKVLGIGVGLGLTYNPEDWSVSIHVDASLVVGATGSLGYSLKNLEIVHSGNTYATIETGGSVGFSGYALGGGAGITYDEGKTSINGGVDLIAIGFDATYPFDHTNGYPIHHDLSLSAIKDRALNNSTGLEADYIRTIGSGDTIEAARAAMKLPGVYQDAILREVAGYGGNSNNGDNDSGGWRDNGKRPSPMPPDYNSTAEARLAC